MNSDHANDQKALARMVADLKRELADATIKARQTDKFLTYICEANEGKAGGVEAWNLLAEGRHGMSEIQQRSIIKFGKDAYNRPSVDVRDALGIDLFAWVGSPPTPTMGCCMHKDLNYEIRQCRNIAPQTIAHHQLHGASLRDNKKGEHDLARHYFLDVIGILLMFADVSNIRYGTDHTIPRTTANPVSLSLLSSGIGWINPIDEIGRLVSTY